MSADLILDSWNINAYTNKFSKRLMVGWLVGWLID